MRNVTRTEKPKTLERNAERWTNDLIEALESGDDEKILAARKKYRKKEVKDALEFMFNSLCGFCEADIATVSYSHIEHLKPIQKFPESGFDWQNLNLACPKCNGSKLDQWDSTNPILNPTGEDNIEEHLTYRCSVSTKSTGLVVAPKTNRGQVTVSHTDLNRLSLCKARVKIFNAAQDIKDKLDPSTNAPINEYLQGEIDELKAGEFGSIISWIGL